MSIRKKFVEILNYQVTMRCDECGKGDMEYVDDNMTIATHPPRYKHMCTNCGNVETYTKRYPYIEQRVIHIPLRGEE